MSKRLQEERAKVAWKILIRQARRGQTITYAALANEMKVHPHSASHFLGLVQNFCLVQKLPHLTALVVQTSTGLPGAGCSIEPSKLKTEYRKIFAYPWIDVVTNFNDSRTPSRYWLHQINPQQWDVERFLEDGNILDDLRFSFYAKDIAIGDPLLLWLSGRDGGVIGLGMITDRPAPLKGERLRDEYTRGEPIKGKFYVGVKFDALFPINPIPRDFLRQNKIFKNSGIIRFPNGGNFSELTATEFFEIKKIFTQRTKSVGAIDSDFPPDVDLGTDHPRQAGAITIQRLVRDSRVTRRIKEMYDFTCQFCGTQLVTPSGKYAEGAHIRPLGGEHKGQDRLSNVLCLCCNCHTLYDLGTLYVDLKTLSVKSTLDSSYRKKIFFQIGHNINPNSLKYQARIIAKIPKS